MKRIRVIFTNGERWEWKVRSASYGHDSRNVILTDVKDAKGGHPVGGPSNSKAESDVSNKTMILIPLQNVMLLTEEDW